MKKVIIFIFILAAAICAVWVSMKACQSGSFSLNPISPSDNMISRNLTLDDFDEIETSRVDIEYTVGTPGNAVLTAPDNVIDNIIVIVKEGELKISLRNEHNYKSDIKATLTVSSSSIKDIDASLSSQVNVHSYINSNDLLDLNATTSARINIDSVKCGEAEFITKTSGKIIVGNLECSGKAFLKASTSAKLNIDKLTANKLDAESSTSADLTVNSGKVGKIDLDASTSSKINMFADYDSGKADASTSGRINLASDNNLNSRETSTHGRIKVR